ncbi:hypothetical protein MKW94_015110 [Papaver nudicaule]|uniref:Neprosin PEP catalytic domain-containing protein n=1 Tax=Papaver nudicaule TaxID=74823 RepID=A0AA41SGS1_PAPNU|nr:hypothetical protein [Papaver nudicaule]
MNTTLLLTILLVVFCLIQGNYGKVEGRRYTLSLEEEDVELENRLKVLNKPPIKSFQQKSGDILDCIDIYKQPAFDHPLLQNHKIQIKPYFKQDQELRKCLSTNHTLESRTNFGLPNERCPPGTVAIRRTKKQELINAKYLAESHGTYSAVNILYKSYHFVSVQPSVGIYYGGKGRVSVENPTVGPDQFSSAQIWVQNGPDEELNSIESGWTVHPMLFGDNDTRLFGRWTADGFKNTGCYNMLCPGFVQVHPQHYFGSKPENISIYGVVSYAFLYSVRRDPQSGNWWLILDDLNENIGYWPKELFSHLRNNASVIRYGGVAGGGLKNQTPQMGNGHFANLDSTKCCNMRDMHVYNNKGQPLKFLASRVKLKQDTTTKCYNQIFWGFDPDHGGLMVSFGGPGGNCP